LSCHPWDEPLLKYRQAKKYGKSTFFFTADEVPCNQALKAFVPNSIKLNKHTQLKE
jgi:hypothetical protein